MGNISPINKRMKENYEDRQKLKLIRRMPVIVRVDGKSFSKFTRGMHKPFDEIFTKCMQEAMVHTCETLNAACFAYTQSDEISFLLIDYKELDTNAFYDNDQQKLVTDYASTVTLAFYKALCNEVQKFARNNVHYRNFEKDMVKEGLITQEQLKKYQKDKKYLEIIQHKLDHSEIKFDARAFNLPREEVVNYFIARQRDAVRNAVSSAARKHFSSKQLEGKNTQQRIEMLKEVGIDFDTDYARSETAGSVYMKIQEDSNSYWKHDKNILDFSKVREEIEKYVYCDTEAHDK